RASSEAGLHLRLYQEQPMAEAVVHTHPPGLLSLELQGKRLLDLELFEAQAYQELLCCVPRAEPGSSRLAELVALAAKDFQAVFMSGHGLVCWAGSLQQAVGLSEELESLARIQLAREGLSR
ncbi:MAG: class II aldolase/adducin family protein, partial [Thermodesulfobacteriota bacterium]